MNVRCFPAESVHLAPVGFVRLGPRRMSIPHGVRMLGAGTWVRLQPADGYSTARRHRCRSRRRTIRGATKPATSVASGTTTSTSGSRMGLNTAFPSLISM